MIDQDKPHGEIIKDIVYQYKSKVNTEVNTLRTSGVLNDYNSIQYKDLMDLTEYNEKIQNKIRKEKLENKGPEIKVSWSSLSSKGVSLKANFHHLQEIKQKNNPYGQFMKWKKNRNLGFI